MHLSNTTLALLAIVPVAGYYLVRLLRWYRVEQLKRYPRLEPDAVWGHLKWMGDVGKKIPPGGHSGMFS
jgi:hypothetical protein